MITTRVIKSVSELKNIINDFQDSSVLLLLDVDDTIIRPKNNYNKQIDKFQGLHSQSNEKEEREHYEHLISAWRLEREVILTDHDWPEFIKNLSKSVFALTKMDVGKFGLIESMEEWRYKELQSLDIKFTHHSPIDGIDYDQPIHLNIHDATFFKGIFYTGNASKGAIVKKLLQHQQYDLVVFVDDNIEQLRDVQAACNRINHIMIQFQNDGMDYDATSTITNHSMI